MSRWFWLAGFVLTGCGGEPRLTREAGATPAAPAFRGPGAWLPAPDARTAPVGVVLQRSGVAATRGARAAADGERVLFTNGGNACASDADTGAMETDVPVGGDDSGDTGLVAGTTEPGEARVVGSGDDEALVVRGGALFRVHLPDGAVEAVPAGGEVLDARLVPGGVAALRADGAVSFPGGSVVHLPTTIASGAALAVDGAALLVATPDVVLRVDGAGATPIAGGALRIAADPASGVIARASERAVVGGGWRWAAPGRIEGLAAVDAASVFAVWVRSAGDDAIVLLDAASGEALGTLDVRDGLQGFDAAADLMIQVRPDEVVTWRVTR